MSHFLPNLPVEQQKEVALANAIGTSWFPDMPPGWRIIRFKNLFQEIYRYPTYYNIEYVSEGIPEVRGEALTPEGYIMTLNDERYISAETSNLFPRTQLQLGDIVMSVRGTMGKIGLVDERYAGANITANLLRLSPDRRLIASDFLRWIMRSTYFDEALNCSAPQTTIKTITMPQLTKIPIALPPRNEQQRIAAYLDASCAAIDAAVAAKRRQIETLDALAESIIHHTVTQGLNPDAKMKGSGLDWLPEVPAHWLVQQIKRTCSLVRGQFTHRPRNDPALYDGPYPFVQTGDITAAKKYIRTYSQTLNELGLSVSKMFPRGTLVMSIAANIGDVAILDFEACFPDSVIGMIPGPKTNLDYLFYLMRAMKSIMLRSAVLSTQLNLNYVRIGTNFAAFPPKGEQEAIAEYLDAKEQEVLSTREILNQQIATLTAYRKSLIHECVTGQRRVTEANVAQVRRGESEFHEVMPMSAKSDQALTDNSAEGEIHQN
jgi:type I restriction enzyme S subunit